MERIGFESFARLVALHGEVSILHSKDIRPSKFRPPAWFPGLKQRIEQKKHQKQHLFQAFKKNPCQKKTEKYIEYIVQYWSQYLM